MYNYFSIYADEGNSVKSQWDLFSMNRNVLLLILFNFWCYYRTIKEKGRARSMNNEKIYAMSFAKIYPLLAAKAQKKGRTLEEVNQIICLLTGYNTKENQWIRFCANEHSGK